ncbi:MAG: PDZ domain-containing protein [Phycisphaerae bacterium]
MIDTPHPAVFIVLVASAALVQPDLEPAETHPFSTRPPMTSTAVQALAPGVDPPPAPGATHRDPAPSTSVLGLDDMVPAPVDRETTARIDRLIRQLGAPSYRDREAAHRSLQHIGPPAFEQLRRAYHTSDDLEVRLRVERIVNDAYLYHQVFRHNGFLGVELHRRDVYTSMNDPRIQDGHIGIPVGVVPDLAADQAGLESGDVIIEVDGEPIREDETVRHGRAFVDEIRRRGDGAPMTLTVLRGDELLDLDVILGARPRQHYTGPGAEELAEDLRHAERRFDIWWARHFRRPPTDAPAPQPASLPSTAPSP